MLLLRAFPRKAGIQFCFEYDPEADKIVIHRMLESGQKHLYTEISISEISREQRTLETVGPYLRREFGP